MNVQETVGAATSAANFTAGQAPVGDDVSFSAQSPVPAALGNDRIGSIYRQPPGFGAPENPQAPSSPIWSGGIAGIISQLLGLLTQLIGSFGLGAAPPAGYANGPAPTPNGATMRTDLLDSDPLITPFSAES